jgi:hypothetical protein
MAGIRPIRVRVVQVLALRLRRAAVSLPVRARTPLRRRAAPRRAESEVRQDRLAALEALRSEAGAEASPEPHQALKPVRLAPRPRSPVGPQVREAAERRQAAIQATPASPLERLAALHPAARRRQPGRPRTEVRRRPAAQAQVVPACPLKSIGPRPAEQRFRPWVRLLVLVISQVPVVLVALVVPAARVVRVVRVVRVGPVVRMTKTRRPGRFPSPARLR